tara:strand:- start:1494 stop:1610 length:117 start_codon:yes stop_codon:yes gene_type:complete
MKLTDPDMPLQWKLDGLKQMAKHIIAIVEAIENEGLVE